MQIPRKPFRQTDRIMQSAVQPHAPLRIIQMHTPILMEHLMDRTATTYSHTTLSDLSGETIKTIMERRASSAWMAIPG